MLHPVPKPISFETETAIRRACDAIVQKNRFDLLLELWNRNLITDDIFVKRLKEETGIPISLN